MKLGLTWVGWDIFEQCGSVTQGSRSNLLRAEYDLTWVGWDIFEQRGSVTQGSRSNLLRAEYDSALGDENNPTLT